MRLSCPLQSMGKMGPDVPKCIRNILLSVENNPPLVKQVADYLREERKLYNKEKFNLVINDGDMGSNILAKNRNIPSLFVTNQFRPKLWKSRSYLYPGLMFIAKTDWKSIKDHSCRFSTTIHNMRIQPEFFRR